MRTFLITLCATALTQCLGTSSTPAAHKPHTPAPPADTVCRRDTAPTPDGAQTQPVFATVYQRADSLKATRLMAESQDYYAKLMRTSGTTAANARQRVMVYIARQLIGVPYVAKTLENDSCENLVVNLRQLDCTTYVESVLAMTLTVSGGEHSFGTYLHHLRMIRYAGGEVSYPARQHYFTEWIRQNTAKQIVSEVSSPVPPFSGVQNLNINFMSTHTQLYPMLKSHPAMVEQIAAMERGLSGMRVRYIPKQKIANTALLRSAIHDGDIIAITTSKTGLDTSHIGIAVWHADGLHMLNASQIHKKVVEEKLTLYEYMQRHPSQTGIRVVRIL